MLNLVDGKVEQVKVSGVPELLKVLMLQFQNYAENVHRVYRKYNKVPDKETMLKECPDQVSISIISEVFTSMVMDAIYFDYYSEKVSKTKAVDWSKSSPASQFSYIAKEFFGLSNPEELDIYSDLISLNKVRIHWVHNKTSSESNYGKALNHFTPDGCVQLLRELMELFIKHDESYLAALKIYDILTELQVNLKGFSGKNPE